MPVNDIKTVTQMVRSVCDSIDSLTDGLECLGDAETRTTLEDIRVGELENIQMLTLELTRKIMNSGSIPDMVNESTGDSAFFAGELNHVKGEYKHEDV